MKQDRRWLGLVSVLLAFTLIAVACGDDDDGGATATATEGVLADVCPSLIIVQTDWHVEAEHGATYEMLGQDYEIDKDSLSVTGSLVASGEVDTGVDIEIREGGPAIGFQQVSAQMYIDQDTFFGYVSTDEAVENSVAQPTVSVVTPLDKNPQIIMWNPEQFPGVEHVADLPPDTDIVAFSGATYLFWLVDQGIIQRSQIDESYDAGPTRFAAADGAYGQQGFASAEPYIYLNETPEYAKEVKYELIHDMGFEIYSQPLAVRPERITEDRACLELLVPIVQQAAVDYVNDGEETNITLIDVNDTYDDGWVYNIGEAEFSQAEQGRLGLIGNGPDDTLGNHDMGRVQTIIDQLVPVFANDDLNIEIVDGLTSGDIATNEFIDDSIGL